MTTETSIYEYAKQGLLASADKPALWFYGKAMTYRQLFEKIDNVADHLYGLGVRQGTVVTIHLPNCPQAVMAIYAVAKLGGICNMVHALMPLEGLRKNMAFTESHILITGSHFADASQVGFADTMLYVSIPHHMGFPTKQLMLLKSKPVLPQRALAFEPLEQPCAEKASNPVQDALAEACVCYLHSSGTMGEPKTVMHSHGNANRFVACTRIYYSAFDLQTQVFLGVLPWFHGLGLVGDLHRAINGGSQIVLMAKWDVATAVKQIKTRRVNHILGVPRIYYALLEHRSFHGRRIEQIGQCLVGGDYVSQALKDQFDSRIGNGRHLCEGYGLSETIATSCVISLSNYRSGASGYPVADYKTAVITRQGVLSYEGTGELVVSTNCMMLGYFKNPTATADAFFECNGRKWLHTGDFGSVDQDGYVYYKGRIKSTIIHNGYNVYPHEVEAIIAQSKHVKDVCVVGVRSEERKTQLVRACVVPDFDVDIQALEKELRAMCRQMLPTFSLPEEYRFIEKIPSNAMGKTDRLALEKLL